MIVLCGALLAGRLVHLWSKHEAVIGTAMSGIEQIRLEAIVENIPFATDFVARFARDAGFGDAALYQIQIAVDEACANVVHHAYKGLETGDLEISCGLDGQSLVIRVRDWGRSFVPEDVPAPDVKAPLEERCLGGLGLFLIEQAMDEVNFAFDEQSGNELIMKKRLLPEGKRSDGG